jgi:hypothetical protein
MADQRQNGPGDVRQLYEEAESRTAQAFEQTVSRESFGELLAWMTENVAAMTRIGFDVFDLILRNLRLAGRQDVIRLARQLNRTEDKLELVLQEIEGLRDELATGTEEGSGSSARANRTDGSSTSRARSGSRGGGRRAQDRT